MAVIAAPDTTAETPEVPVVSRGRIQLPHSPKLLIGLVLLIAFIVLAVDRPADRPVQPDPQPVHHQRGAAGPVGRALAGHHPAAAGRAVPAAGRRAQHVVVAGIAGVVATVLSVVIGVTSGYLGGLADDLLSMLANIFLVMPALPLLIVVFGFLPRTSGSNDLLIGLIIALTGWAWGARVLRSQTLSLRERDYVLSAQIIGERTWRIIGWEILPNLLPIVASSFLFTVLYGVGHLHGAGLPRPDQPRALELGGDAVLGAVLLGRDQRLLVVVHPGRAGRGAAGHLAGPAELRHRRVHQPAAAGRRADPQAPPGSRARRPCPGGSCSASLPWCGTPVPP